MQWDEDWGYESVRQRRIDEEDQMNINYDEIIAKANDRRLLLQSLTEQLKNTPTMVKQLVEVQQWAEHVSQTFASLDREGRDLLPKDIAIALEYSSSAIAYLKRSISGDNNIPGIEAWSENV